MDETLSCKKAVNEMKIKSENQVGDTENWTKKTSLTTW